MRSGASAGAGGARAWLEAFVVAGLVLAYTLSLRRFGLDLIDEGTLFSQFADVARGAMPYRDFQTGYGPLGFYWNAAILRWVGWNVVDVRTVLAFAHATSAGLLYAIARRAGGAALAVAVVVLVWGMLRPVAPGTLATFNVPYPSWLAEAFGYAAVLAVLGAGGRTARVAAAGALWGLAFLSKQNAGIFGLAGTVVYLALTTPPRGSDGRIWLGGLLALAMTLGIVGLSVGGGMTAWEAVVLGTPVVMLAVAVVRARPGAELVTQGLVLAGGFTVVVAPVLIALGAELGSDVVVHEVLHLGSGAAERFRLSYPTPASIVEAAWVRAPSWLAAGRDIVDRLWMLVLPAAAIAGASTLALAGRRASDERILLVAVGALLYLQLYPRADVWHVLPAAGLLVTLALCLLGDALPARRGGLFAAAIALAAVRSAPTVPVIAGALTHPTEPVAHVAHASLRWDLLGAPYLRRIPQVAATLEGVHSLFGFPALAFFGFLADAPSPVRHDYFFPGHPGAEEIAEMLDDLKSSPPEAVVVLNAPVAFSEASFAAHPDVVAWLRSPTWVYTTIAPYSIGRRARP